MAVLVLESGDSLTLLGVPPSDGIQVKAGATLIYGANQTDASVAYLKEAGGTVQIAAGVTLASNSCTFNGSAIADDTIGAAYYVDSIGAGGDWVVDGDIPVVPPVTPHRVTTSMWTIIKNFILILSDGRFGDDST